MLIRRSFLTTASMTLALAAHAIAAPVTPSFTYQGQLKNAGSPASGSFNMVFSLWDDPAAGNQVGPTLTFDGIGGHPAPVSVASGLFTVSLDFGAAPYNGNRRWLAINVNGTPLTPRQELTSAPYARFSSAPWATSGNDVSYSSGNVGIGTTSPGYRLDVHTGEGDYGVAHTDGTHDVTTFVDGGGGWIGTRSAFPLNFYTADSYAHMTIATNGNVGIGTTTPGFPLSFPDLLGDKISLWGQSGNNFGFGIQGNLLQMHTDNNSSDIAFGYGSSGAFTETMRIKGNGNVGIGTTTPGAKLHVVGGGVMLDGANTMEFGAGISPKEPNAGKIGYQSFSTGLDIVGAGTDSTDRRITLWGEGGTQTMGPLGITNGAPDELLTVGNFGIGDTYAAIQTIGGNQVRAGIKLRHYNMDYGWTIESDERIATFGLNFLQHFNNTAGVSSLFIQEFSGNVGIGTTAPAAKLDVMGTARVQAITVTGGSDLAEPYDVAPTSGIAPKPGMVVSIDSAHIGKMRVTAGAYDRTVAGIISGANGINPGITLSQSGTVADGQLPVASAGRVWCWCDADAAGAINAGDLLTTSATAGHAMKVADFDRANGAVVGKAMSSLRTGKGLVLVLVSLK